MRVLAVLLLAPAALHCSSSSSVENTKAPSQTTPPQKIPGERADELLAGTWRLLKEQAHDGLGPFFEQERRVFVFSKEGSYELENSVSKLSGSFTLQGGELTLQTSDKPQVIELLSVTSSELVLVEDLPEIYLREGPARRVRNTYRRVSESAFGPVLGDGIEVKEPLPGQYSGSYEYSMSKLPTMEITSDRQVSGRARLLVAPDGSAESCFAVHTRRQRSESKYSSSDGQHHSSDDHSYWLEGGRGRWQSKDGKLLVTIERTWLGSCDTSEGPGDISGPLDLECVAIAANNKLPVPIVACKILKSHSLLNEVSINPADSERAGPYTMQVVPRGHVSVDSGQPWILLAIDGLALQSEDGRRNDAPVLSFSTPALPLIESQFKSKPVKP